MNTKISDLTKYFEIKQDFQKLFCKTLGLNMIESPIAIENNIEYLQDNLTGIEEPVRFKNYQFVHSLAKWKRFMLKDCEIGTGICTNMYGVRQNEELDNIHSYFVRQWDWEKIIEKEDRNINTLIEYVDKIYYCIKTIVEKYSSHKLPDNIQYISNQLIIEESEIDDFVKKYKAVCLTQISDKRSPDYDDWSLNCDILLYFPVLDCTLELSSMGIRVDKESLIQQCLIKNKDNLLNKPYYKDILQENIPFTIGGGIGQDRLIQFIFNLENINVVI